ncbi:MAG: PrsW family intramembrane metalloprotease [Flexilinea sp.]|nr:PrsW family intramembrane metalloprotease [Flexilinea sp.]
MNYIENIFICLTAPLLIAVLCLKGGRRRMIISLLAGMTACLLSSYISTFIAVVMKADRLSASLEIAPMVEEIMKLFPLLFYLLVFEPRIEDASGSLLMISVGFATFENVCYLTTNGAAQVFHLLIRGFGTGAMHVVCGALVSLGLFYLWDQLWLRTAGTIGLLGLAITYHGIYNILVSQTGIAAWIGYLIPLLTAFALQVKLKAGNSVR